MMVVALLILIVAPLQAEWRQIRSPAGDVIELDLSHEWISDFDLARLARWKHLRKIDLSHTRVTSAGFEALASLPDVRVLECRYAEFVDENAVAQLVKWPKLERLNLRGTKVTSRVFGYLGRIRTLRSLDLSHTQIDDEGFEELASLPYLEELSIGGNRLNGSALVALKAIPTLRRLDASGLQRVDSGLWGLPLTDANVQRLAALKQLRHLSLSGATLADRGVDRPGHPEAERTTMPDLSALTALEALETLDLSRTPITLDRLAPLLELRNLKELALGLTPQLARDDLMAHLGGRKVRIAGK
jgi:Leucine-rich repeat (LRR) protein